MYGYAQPSPPVGRWLVVNNFNEIQNAPLPMDGSQTMYMLANEPVFYIVAMLNGQRMVQGYTFTALTPETQPKQPPTVDERITNLEENLSKIVSLLEGSKINEPNIQRQTKAKQANESKSS